ncbi:bel12-ag transposon polyprotein [Lasius niger]|uniref:Bel12-ag transposon polyprotein n=1 Tax=Lasius niger TaxID=67767 RepID=A0A0J7KBP1_LASNI|nr:bel12-ag transposon polyprotein [Lasius niger]
MFRQIDVVEQDRNLQQILWREEATQPIQIYTLNTVTYGMTCAPFLAMRCVRELAHQGKTVTPKSAEVLEDDFYMDDLLTGTDTKSEAIRLQKELSELLTSAQFPLRKWRTNDRAILNHLTEPGKTENLLILDKQESVKTLGLLWNSNEDVLQYEIKQPNSSKVTKRRILSTIAQIYNPLGLIGPVVMTVKQIMQGLWKLSIGWDEEVSADLKSKWDVFCESWNHLQSLKIPRNVGSGKQKGSISLHGFCDASEKGFGACVYVLSKGKNDEV